MCTLGRDHYLTIFWKTKYNKQKNDKYFLAWHFIYISASSVVRFGDHFGERFGLLSTSHDARSLYHDEWSLSRHLNHWSFVRHHASFRIRCFIASFAFPSELFSILWSPLWILHVILISIDDVLLSRGSMLLTYYTMTNLTNMLQRFFWRGTSHSFPTNFWHVIQISSRYPGTDLFLKFSTL